MPNLSIKNVPEDVVDKWRQRAAANHRSLQGELLAMVIQGVQAEPPENQVMHAGSVRRGHKSIEQIMAEQLERNPKPIRKGGRAVDMIRADRDER